jgi:HPt (histidine-containing phosphotransfer) domain-containing protein
MPWIATSLRERVNMVSSKDPSRTPQSSSFSGQPVSWANLSAKDRHVFIESITRDLKSIEDAWHGRDGIRLSECIHSLKGALFIVGEHAAASDCAVAEQGIQTQDLDACAGDVERLSTSLRNLLELYGRS